MNSSSSTPPVPKPPGAKPTAKRTSNFRPWSGMSRGPSTMSPTSTSTSPQDPSPVKIISDIPTANAANGAAPDGTQQPTPSLVTGSWIHNTLPTTQTPTLVTTPAVSKGAGISMTEMMQKAQRLWEAKQTNVLSKLSKDGQGDGNRSPRPKGESPVGDGPAAQEAKPTTESPVPLPSYAYGIAQKRSATDMSDAMETPTSKRQHISSDVNSTGSQSFPPPVRRVDVDGRMMNILETTGSRRYSEFWVPDQTEEGSQSISDGGAILPSGYELLDTAESRWVCPVRDCQKRMAEVRRLGGHLSASHNSKVYNDNGDGTLSQVGVYRKGSEKSAPPVVVSCNPIAPDAPPRRPHWIGAPVKEKTKSLRGRTRFSIPSSIPTSFPAPRTEQPEILEYLHQSLSPKQPFYDREDIKYLSNQTRLRELPNAWIMHHEAETLDPGHYTSALAYLVGEEVTEGQCRQNEGRGTCRLSEKCIKLPTNMPMQARVYFSKQPICVGCKYWGHLQRRTNDCDWNLDRHVGEGDAPTRKLHTSKKSRLSDEEGYISNGSSTAESGGSVDPVAPAIEDHQPTSKRTTERESTVPQEKVDIDTAAAMNESPRRSRHRERDAQAAAREASPGLAPERRHRSNATPRMRDWEYTDGRLFDPSGQWAVAWSTPYNTGREPFQIGSNIKIHRLRLGPGETHSWKADEDEFRHAEIHVGEIDLKINGGIIGALTQGSIFKIIPGHSCRIENHCVSEALISVTVVGNYRRLCAD